MIMYRFTFYLLLKVYMVVSMYSLYQGGYIISLYLNNQIINILILTICITLFIKKIKHYILIPVLSYLFLYTLELVQINTVIEWPISLLIGLNTIHPYLYYFSFITILLLLWKFLFFNIIIRKTTVIYISFIALVLGMAWGSINDLWGFFWVNDLIELILLFLIILMICYTHIYSKNSTHIYTISLLTIIIILYSVRLGLVGSRHSFFLDLQISSYTNYSYILLLYLYSGWLLYGYLTLVIYFYIFIFIFSYILSLYLQIVIYKKFITPKFILLLHLTFTIITISWLFIAPNFALYYTFSSVTIQVKEYFYSCYSMLLQSNIFLLNSVVNPRLSLFITNTNNLYLYKLYVGLFKATISYSYLFVNIFIFIFFKKYYLYRY